ncbi:hypothetical protein K505DRAFT_165924 [Melanomma pulvis-pyrius CBS 109.77]|uniref:Uncharacterized protein n=1 Tax=Melanomma pulvis-pyrius CBS 109.77 TaxID=1314802 RepID=A0A6A6XJ43_9PLEO|nr:hypothetical protein K505DRAFT_165924 [Melanomma pulvis-pyrius CBS 109.77]
MHTAPSTILPIIFQTFPLLTNLGAPYHAFLLLPETLALVGIHQIHGAPSASFYHSKPDRPVGTGTSTSFLRNQHLLRLPNMPL